MGLYPLLNRTVVNDKDIAVVYVLIIATYLCVLFFKKTYYKVRYDRDFFVIPQLQIRSISGISMMTAMNIALIITISMLSNQIMGVFFKVYPGARFLIENVLIKLGGIMFGPVVGIFIGFTTDLLTVILTSSVLNYGYFFSAMINGFLGGIIHIILKIKDDKKIKPTAASIVMAVLSLLYLAYLLERNSGGGVLSARILSFTLSLHWTLVFAFVFLIVLFVASYLSISTYAVCKMQNPKYVPSKFMKKCADKYMFLLILMCNCTIYLVVDIISLPIFDIKLSTLPYEQFLICRIITSVPALILFSYLIHYIYKLHSSIKDVSGKATALEQGLQPVRPKPPRKIPVRIMH